MITWRTRSPFRNCIPCRCSWGSSCRSSCNSACPPQKRPRKCLPTPSTTRFWRNPSCANHAPKYWQRQIKKVNCLTEFPTEWRLALSQEAIRFRDYVNLDSRILRCFVVTVSIAAWFLASNHCVLAAPTVGSRTSASSQCPMHGQKQHPSQPQRGNGCGDLPCCKNLQATTLMAAKMVAKPVWLGALLPFFPHIIDVAEIQPQQISASFDTGPPGQNNFVQSVLQRSILAHAPPASLS